MQRALHGAVLVVRVCAKLGEDTRTTRIKSRIKLRMKNAMQRKITAAAASRNYYLGVPPFFDTMAIVGNGVSFAPKRRLEREPTKIITDAKEKVDRQLKDNFRRPNLK